MKFTAAGDIIIQRRIQNDFVGFEELAPFIKQGDARFFNLETTINYEGECNSSQLSGGTYIRTNPEVLEDIKKLKNPVAIRSTFMCGFPGETKRDFKILKQFLIKQKLYNVGFFAFSREEGTRAYSYKKQVPGFLKNKRVKALQKIQAQIMIENQQKYIGNTLQVLVDEVKDNNTYIGRTQYQSPGVDTVVYFTSEKPISTGEFVNVKITGISDSLDLYGEQEIETKKCAKKLTNKKISAKNKTTKK